LKILVTASYINNWFVVKIPILHYDTDLIEIILFPATMFLHICKHSCKHLHRAVVSSQKHLGKFPFQALLLFLPVDTLPSPLLLTIHSLTQILPLSFYASNTNRTWAASRWVHTL